MLLPVEVRVSWSLPKKDERPWAGELQKAGGRSKLSGQVCCRSSKLAAVSA